MVELVIKFEGEPVIFLIQLFGIFFFFVNDFLIKLAQYFYLVSF